MAEFPLRFRGARYPRAEISLADRSSKKAPVFLVSSPNGGKPWATEEPLGFWRDFAAIDLANKDQIVEFTRRRGMVCSEPLGGSQEELTKDWRAVQSALRLMERAWDPVDAEGVSRVSPKRAEDIRKASAHDPDAQRFGWERGRLSLVPGPDGMIPVATTLATYMISSALFGIISPSGGAMRRCDYCQGWYIRQRSDARFCCDSHRTQQHLKAKQQASVVAA